MDEALKSASAAASSAAASSAFQSATITARDAAISWYKNVSLGTGTVVAVSVILSVIDFITFGSIRGVFCLKASAFLMNLWRFFTYPIFHAGVISLIVDILVFVPLASHLERSVGTIQFFWLVSIVFPVIIGLFFVTIFLPLTLIVNSWTTACGVGLSGVIFLLLSADANSGAGPFETRNVFGVTIVGAMWPYIAFIVAFFFYPWSSIILNLGGIMLGYLYGAGWLSKLALPPRVVGYLESSSAASWMADRAIFIPNPNPDGGLPMPGGLPGGGGYQSLDRDGLIG